MQETEHIVYVTHEERLPCKTRSDMICLALLAIEECRKIQKILDDVFAKCEADLERERK